MDTTPFEGIIEDIKSKTKELEMKIDERRNDFWNIILEKVCKHLKTRSFVVEDNAKPIYYKGYAVTLWKFLDNKIHYEFREERVSSYDGYTRYQVKIEGPGVHQTYESDDKFGHYDTITDNAMRYIMKNLHEHSYKCNSKNYAERKLKEIEELIKIIK